MKLTLILGALCLNFSSGLARPESPGENMADPPKPPAFRPRGARSYAAFQSEIFVKGARGVRPAVTTDPNKLEAQAKKKMTPQAYGFLAGGAGERATMDANRLAFRQWKLIPRMLRGPGMRNISVQLFGKTYPTPVMFAPIGFQTVFHSEAEAGVAAIANEINVPFIMSMNSASSVEDIAKANKNGERWYQFYWPSSDYRTITVLNRAKASGFHVLVVTLDAFTLGWRPWDLDQAFFPTNMPSFTPPQNRTFPNKTFPNKTLTPDIFFSAPPSWERLKFLRQNWPGPIVLKGIQHVEDAKLAVTAGMDGIIVSNHGGRQLDGGVGSLEVLPEIVDAVGDKLAVLFDSGIRTGSDIIKALSLGAKAVLIGRPWAYGLGVAGKAGAKQVMQGILAELEINMSIAGLKSVSECGRSNLRKANYAGDRHSSE